MNFVFHHKKHPMCSFRLNVFHSIWKYMVQGETMATIHNTFFQCGEQPLSDTVPLPCRIWIHTEGRYEPLMALFHCMVRHGTVRYGSLLGGFPLGTVPGTWYFFSTTSVEVPSSRTVTKTWRVNSADHWMAGENRHYCVTELATRDPPLPLYPLDLNQHSQRRIGRNFCLNKRTFLHQPQNSSVVVCWGSSDVPLVDSRGADPARAWWRDAEGKALCI